MLQTGFDSWPGHAQQDLNDGSEILLYISKQTQLISAPNKNMVKYFLQHLLIKLIMIWGACML